MKTRKPTSKRAFTLMELLIVVIVIGVLAAVTLPKFNRVIENRKVTEAEEMMSAVRTEQEKRCSLDQNYTTNFDNLKDIIASNTTKNYTYSLQPQGISAQSNSSGYTLKILSYEDGSYCCEGEGCKKLNKNYPDCSTLSFPESVCIGDDSGLDGLGPDPDGRECTDGEVQGSQTCNICGTQTTQVCVNGKWTSQLGSCSKTVEECTPDPDDGGDCKDRKPDETEECPCGDIRTRSVTCVNKKWVTGEWDRECTEVCDVSCATARADGTLDDFCAAGGRFPLPEDPTDSQVSLTLEHCCKACPSHCTFDAEKKECITKNWEVSTEELIGIRYSSADPVAKIGTEVAGQDVKHFGSFEIYGGDSNGVCDFSMPGAVEVPANSLQVFNSDDFLARCDAECDPSASSCDLEAYFFKDNSWSNYFSAPMAGGDAFCWLSEEQSNNRLDFADVARTGLTKYPNMSIQCGNNWSFSGPGACNSVNLSKWCQYNDIFKIGGLGAGEEMGSVGALCLNFNEANYLTRVCRVVTGIPSQYMTDTTYDFPVLPGSLMDGTNRTDVDPGCKIRVTVSQTQLLKAQIVKAKCNRRPKAGEVCTTN